MSKESRERMQHARAMPAQRLSRRNALKYGSYILSGSVLATLGTGEYVRSKNKRKREEWPFIAIRDEHPDRSRLTDAEIARLIQRSVPLHETSPLQPGSLDFEEAKATASPHLDARLKKAGIAPDHFKVKITLDQFADPAEASVAHAAEKYCIQALDYMYARIKGLEKVTVLWTQIRLGDSYIRNAQSRGFIGSEAHEVQSIYVHDTTGKNVFGTEPALYKVTSDTGAFADWSYNSIEKKVDSWYMFLAANENLLQTPFNETLPLAMVRTTMEYAVRPGIGVAKAEEAVEAISEGLTQFLAAEFTKSLGIPQASTLLAASFARTRKQPRYKYVEPSVRWIARHGMQQAYDLYMEDPAKYMEEIQK